MFYRHNDRQINQLMTTVIKDNFVNAGHVGSFVLLWISVFVFSVIGLVVLNIAPPEIKETVLYALDAFKESGKGMKPLGSLDFGGAQSTSTKVTVSTDQKNDKLLVKPTRIVIPKISVDIAVVNPLTNDIDTLDRALQEGVVRYPGSGSLLDESKIFLFGHSSYLPMIRNRAYKAFNELGMLNLGDEIFLYGNKSQFVFKVIKIEKVKAKETLVQFGKNGIKKLVLSTCDSFGDESERFVVEAELIGSRAI
ncbi:MAG: hypothetical protein A3H57_00365 [Candidatus Taylorbacteria bacterium RIFCSPLOWO2_02_FULL_43_11]|uniref:Sortase n=1 Tax=Candidatus Taylorbacteria bacterium RIFCSPHIGHO2_02_FULL_43_32b TaxID=1802306 RepID=A0A1G2MEE0_9BACT|nr:MAG: hypothetical protein A2743_04350 [Candidatus Taylorbacteria bacterium RIFCSPHIGHO2_01_FULL_43_47]OHA22280.1 MAG: hypothetical protein A3C72_04245 [Candidatus Taylorbacteria bacterium RIFCSPHIGHO2_02_FULL_43_32b]OHA36447.1 MAG: hypothetical protein A3H57_00365 [Candidatus Taylorbacteria bacterium RIFCSPLOWO2_02_FULL_43_11]